MSEPLRRPEPPPPRSSCLSIFLAGGLLALTAVALFALSLGTFLPVMVIGGLILFVAGFHYVVWGWWLGPMIHREAEEEAEHEP
jgi:hypothetical protein